MSITFDISPDILEKYSEQDLKDIFEIVLIKIKR
jgi:hypothetical protein